MAQPDFDSEETTHSHIYIRSFGEHWDPNSVRWSRTGRLWGRENQHRGGDINVYNERGIYVLYKDYSPVYVGKAFRQSIGSRLERQRGSMARGSRWNSFSWFGLRGYAQDDTLNELDDKTLLDPAALVATLEALLITAIDPKLNARKESLRGATRLFQSHTDKPVDVDTQLHSIRARLDEINAKLDGRNG